MTDTTALWAAAVSAAAAVLLGLAVLHLRKRLDTYGKRREELEREALLAGQKLRQMEDQQVSFSQEKRELAVQLEEYRQRVARRDQRITQYESEEQQRKRDLDQRIRELHQARESLEQERERIIFAERKHAEEQQNHRDRQWALHEQNTLRILRELCGRTDLYFPSFDNTDLPDGFDRSLKPDFLIRFLDQYVIFDAKLSKSQNLQSYLAGQAKQTARKIAGSSEKDLMYRVVFFVVPAADLEGLKTLSYYEEGFQFFCIPPEALEPILMFFKRLESYEFAQAYNPQEREQIVQVIAALEHHIRHQNAVHIISALRGIQSLEVKDVLDDDMKQSVLDKRKSIRIENFTPSSLRRLMHDDQALREEILRIISPQPAPVEKEDFQDLE